MDESHLSSDSSKGSAQKQSNQVMNSPPRSYSGFSSVRCCGELTYDTDLPHFNKGTLDVLDVGQTLVQIRPEHITSLWVALCDGSENPENTTHIINIYLQKHKYMFLFRSNHGERGKNHKV